jgi:hypothetical protein
MGLIEQRLIEGIREKQLTCKYEDMIRKFINGSEESKQLFDSLDWSDGKQVRHFVEQVFGEPQKIWTNTYENQLNLVRRAFDQIKSKEGATFRKDFSGDLGLI